MPLKAAAFSVGIVKRKEKEAKLGQFISEHVARQIAGRMTCLLVARSAESPVAKAMLSAGTRFASKLLVRAIFANLGGAEAARIAEACTASELALQVRWARDLRLMDAHEQLVLPPARSWTGDCMRREPAKSDAHEWFAPECPDTARRAALFFERLWGVSEPVIERLAPHPCSAPEPPPKGVLEALERPNCARPHVARE
jgi:hypothetical protein